MSAATYFKLLATLMKKNPPAAADSPIIAKIAKVAIVPGREFEMGKLDPVVAKALEQAATTGLEQIVAEIQHTGNSERLADDFYREIWHRLSVSRGDRIRRPRRESAARRALSDDLSRWKRAAIEGRQQVRDAFRQGQVSASEWFLVFDHIQRRIFLVSKTHSTATH